MKHRYWILFCVILISLGTFGCGDDITKKYFQEVAEDLPPSTNRRVPMDPTSYHWQAVTAPAAG